MNNTRKEKLRIANLVMEICDREIAYMSVDFSNYGYSAEVTEWIVGPGSAISIAQKWTVHDHKPDEPQLRKIRHDLEQILASAKTEKVAA